MIGDDFFFCSFLDLASLALLQCVWPCSFVFLRFFRVVLLRFFGVLLQKNISSHGTLYCAFFHCLFHKLCAIFDLLVLACVLGMCLLVRS